MDADQHDMERIVEGLRALRDSDVVEAGAGANCVVLLRTVCTTRGSIVPHA